MPERSITEFGMQSGVTFDRISPSRGYVDPDYKTGTAEAFGLRAESVYEPFLGGGFITATVPLGLINSLRMLDWDIGVI